MILEEDTECFRVDDFRRLWRDFPAWWSSGEESTCWWGRGTGCFPPNPWSGMMWQGSGQVWYKPTERTVPGMKATMPGASESWQCFISWCERWWHERLLYSYLLEYIRFFALFCMHANSQNLKNERMRGLVLRRAWIRASPSNALNFRIYHHGPGGGTSLPGLASLSCSSNQSKPPVLAEAISSLTKPDSAGPDCIFWAPASPRM